MNLLLAMESWISLTMAILFGVLGTTAMKLSHGLQIHKYSAMLIISYAISFIALTFAVKHIPLSVVYAVWSGIGTILVAAIGIVYFHESLSFKKIIYLVLILLGVIGMHLSDGIF